MTTKPKGVKDKGFQFSNRWTESEREGIKVGTLGFGDVSRWSQGVSKPFGRTKPAEIGCVNLNMPDCGEPVNRNSQPITSLRNVREFYEREPKPAKWERLVTVPTGTFDEAAHAVKVASITQGIQARLEKVFAKAKVRKKGQKAAIGKERAKERIVPLKDIKPIEGFKMRVPDFLSREPKTEIGPCIERGEVEKVQWERPSQGGRAGRIEKWGE